MFDSVVVVLFCLTSSATGANHRESDKSVQEWPVVREQFVSLLKAYERIGVEREFARGFNINLFKGPIFHKEKLTPMEAVAEVIAGHYKQKYSNSKWLYGKRYDYDQLFVKHFSGPCSLLTNLALSKDFATIERVKDEMTVQKYDYILKVCHQLLQPDQQEKLYVLFKNELNNRFDLVDIKKTMAEQQEGLPLSKAIVEPQMYSD